MGKLNACTLVTRVILSLFLALGKGTAGFVLGACRQGICFVPIILLLPSFWGINGILYAQPIADVISAPLLGV
jgi:Na+-driven multidrug efflux pump